MQKSAKIDSISLAKEIHQETVAMRRDFHMYPEIGFELYRTAGIVSNELKNYGLQVKTGINKTGVVGDLKISKARKTIALRADMDALPMQELNDIPYKSQNQMCAHMCGHDAHTAMLLGAAKLLSKLKNELEVNVRFIFQPSEEAWPGGAPGMIREGVLEGVDEIYALHVWPTLQTGQFGICKGPAMAQPDGFDIKIKGRGGHAAAPHLAIDPILIASQIIQTLQLIISQNVNSTDNAVLTVTQIHGGTCYNVIPDECNINGTVRTYEKETQKMIKKRIFEVTESISKAFGAVAEVKYYEGYPVTYNHEETAEKVRDIAASLVGNQSVSYPAQKAMFGEDFAYYTEKTKGCFIHLGCGNESKKLTRMLHDPQFNIDENCLIFGTALFLELALNNPV